MQKLALTTVMVMAAVSAAGHLLAGRASAHPAFKKEFDSLYLAKGSPLANAYGGRSNCNVCHVGGTMDRKHRNAYGQALDKLLDENDALALTMEAMRRNPTAAKAAEKKIQEAFQRVEKMPSNPAQAKSPTFGELIRAGKLPVSPPTLPLEPDDS
jgi:outer membrane murein-binding lipoprotein Lpp